MLQKSPFSPTLFLLSPLGLFSIPIHHVQDPKRRKIRTTVPLDMGSALNPYYSFNVVDGSRSSRTLLPLNLRQKLTIYSLFLPSAWHSGASSSQEDSSPRTQIPSRISHDLTRSEVPNCISPVHFPPQFKFSFL